MNNSPGLDLFKEFSGAVGNLFDYMEIAEQAVDGVISMHPQYADAVFNTFKQMLMAELPPKPIFRVHCECMALKAVEKENPEFLTDGEILYMLMKGGLAAPLNRDHFVLYYTLFRKHFPDWDLPGKDDYIDRESREGACEELYQSYRRKKINREPITDFVPCPPERLERILKGG